MVKQSWGACDFICIGLQLSDGFKFTRWGSRGTTLIRPALSSGGMGIEYGIAIFQSPKLGARLRDHTATQPGKKNLRRGSEKAVSRRSLERPLGDSVEECDTSGVRPMKA